MISPCSDVHAFADGELDAAAHERFAAHLAGCRSCGRELEDILLLSALADDAREVLPQSGPVGGWGGGRRMRRRRWGQTGAAAVALAAGITLAALPGRRQSERPAATDPAGSLLAALAGGPHRQLEGRLAYPGLDQYRRLNNQRGGGGAPPADLGVEQGMAELEARGDLHGLGVAQLLLGNLARARVYLEQAPPSAAVLNDRATLALRLGKHGEALALTERVLQQVPDQPQATWNRALALDGLRRSPRAAEAFERAAALAGAAGWAEEARDRAHRLRVELAGGGPAALGAPEHGNEIRP